MEILNLAGPGYDFGDVLFAVLQECEHKRRAFEPDEAKPKLMEIARRKLDEIHESYREAGGSGAYWEAVEREILETAMPQYIAGAVEQNRLERNSYDIWRHGDPLARGAFGLGGLALGALILATPLHPFLEDPFALALAAGGIFYPDIRRLFFDWRHTRLMNRLVVAAEKYQRNSRIHYVSNARMEEELRSLGGSEVRSSARQKQDDDEPPAPPPAPMSETHRPPSNVVRHRTKG